jgi:hypothetical protein
MLTAFFSVLSLGASGFVQEPASADPMPELKITARNGTVEVRIADRKVTLTGTRVSVDQNKQRIVVEGGDKPATLTCELSNCSGKKITFDYATNRVVITGTGSILLPKDSNLIDP